MATENPHLGAVLRYAQHGWRVFSCHSVLEGTRTCGGSRSKCKPGKHPRTAHGAKDASTDKGKIEAWATQWPRCNWAVATGPDSGVFVLDVDGEKGMASLAALETKYESLPATRTSTTGRGEHRWFRYPATSTVRNSTGRLGPGLDIRGNGGYVLVPPSIHANGTPYEWRDAKAPTANAPDWLMELLAEDARQEQNLLPHHVSVLVEGERNDGLFRYGGALRRKGLTRDRILAELQGANQRRCKPPLPPDEIEGIASSAARYAAGGPDPLERARKAIPLDTPAGYEQFLALARNLQLSRPGQTIALPLEKIGELMRRDWTQIRRWRKRAERQGRLLLKERALWLRRRSALYTFRDVPLASDLSLGKKCPISTNGGVPLSLSNTNGLVGHSDANGTETPREKTGEGLMEIVL